MQNVSPEMDAIDDPETLVTLSQTTMYHTPRTQSSSWSPPYEYEI
jgi:hypothetical protein